jgi:hypothetical protein
MRRPDWPGRAHQQLVGETVNVNPPTFRAKPNKSQVLRQSARFRLLTTHLHNLGVRPVGEALLEVAAGRDLIETLEAYARLSPQLVAIVGGRHWPPLPTARIV